MSADLRVLHIGSQHAWRGGETQVELLIDGLKKAGCFCAVAYPKNGEAYARLSAHAFGIPLYSSKGFDLRSVWRVLREIRFHKINIIHAHSSNALTLAHWVKFLYPSASLIYHRHVGFRPKRRLWTKLKYKTKKINRIIAVSHAIKDVLIAYGVSENLINVVYSTVDATRFQNQSKDAHKKKFLDSLGLSSDTILVGNAAALTREKGHAVLLKAIAKLQGTSRPFHLCLAGEGPLLNDLRQLAKTLKIDKYVTFTGFVADIPSFLAALDILVFPSTQEGLGLVIHEALLSNCAVIATRVGGIPEMITHAQEGLLASPGDDGALASYINQLIGDDHLRRSLASRGRAKILDQFSPQKMIQDVLDVYQSLNIA